MRCASHSKAQTQVKVREANAGFGKVPVGMGRKRCPLGGRYHMGRIRASTTFKGIEI
jgi:hypothetical protein